MFIAILPILRAPPQGIANAAGMAAAAKMAAAQFNTDKHTIFSNHIIALCGDGCMQVLARFGLHALLWCEDTRNTACVLSSYGRSVRTEMQDFDSGYLFHV